MAKEILLIPAAARTFKALRDLGYDLNSAVCDIIDNSITRGKAGNVYIWFDHDKNKQFRIRIYDDGYGMTGGRLEEAMRIGSKNDDYEKGDLSKFGMGMKTASLSQANKLTVISRRHTEMSSYCWDMQHVSTSDKWELLQNSESEIDKILSVLISERHGTDAVFLQKLFARKSMTAVLWDDLKDFQDNYNAYRSLVSAENFYHKTSDELVLYIRLIFHRFLSGENDAKKLNIYFNSKKLSPFDPFCRNEENTIELDMPLRKKHFRFEGIEDPVIIHRYILPTNPSKPGRFRFSSQKAWEEAKGVLSWNEAQGYYIYRNNRLISFGGWFRTKALDEHDKLARASIDLTEAHDELFTLTVNKNKVKLPEELKHHLIDNVNKGFIAQAKTRYSAAEKKLKPVINNDIRSKVKKVSHLSNELVNAENITVTEHHRDNIIVIKNPYGSKVSEDLTYKMLEAGQKIISKAFVDDKYFWKMIPSPDSDFQVLVNKNHPFYEFAYGDCESDQKTTAIMDAFLFAMSFIELKCITDNNEFLFEQVKEVASSVLKKFVEDKILQP